ncbi:MAG: murein biosynthesis integral membrane protein MurJ [Coriobacteriia bacterium]|nr:murein biosynthesis integral membrane protein MurJ [Coriobacteriia bacterium]
MLSRITGFLRIWATAFALGATGLMSAYSVANNIPNMIFELVAGGIISSLFIPMFMELREQTGDDAAWAFSSRVFNLALLCLGVIGVIGTIFPEPFIWTQTFRMSPQEAAKVVPAATFFFRFFALQVVLYGAGSIISGLLNSRRQYFWPAVGPVFNNVVAIGAMLAFVALGGDVSGQATAAGPAAIVLALGTTLAVFVMFAVQVPAVFKSGWKYSAGLGLRDPAVRRMLRLAIPTFIYVVTNLVAVSFRNSSALAVSEKGVSVLTYAWVFYQLPYGILAVALATAVFTELSDSAGKTDMVAFKQTFARGLRATGVMMLPASAVMVALAVPLVTLYRVGAFTAEDIPLVAGALRWWAAGLIFYALTMFLLRTFYSLKDTKTPMWVNLALTIGVQITLYVVLSTGVGEWAGIGINGIPMADVAAYFCISVTLGLLLRRRIGGFDSSGVTWTFARMAFASAIGGAAAWAITWASPGLAGNPGGALIQVTLGGIVGLGIAFGVGRILGVAEVASGMTLARRTIARRFGRGA